MSLTQFYQTFAKKEKMATSLQHMRDELSCCVCLELFTNPKTLPCEHSLCETCLNSVQTQISPTLTSVDCPLCRRSFQFDSEQYPKKNHVLERIVEVYKEDAIRRTKSCSDLSAIASKKSSSDVEPLQQIPEFCRPHHTPQIQNVPVKLTNSVLDLRATFTNCDRVENEAECLTRCTASCTDPPGRAVFLCATCGNQFCRVCWGREHDLQRNEGHDINVYITAFREPDGKDILCSVCDPQSSEKAKIICLHCNVNFCRNCFEMTHPEINIHHSLVTRPDIIPEQRYCSLCTPKKIATSICTICKDFCFCKKCLPKASLLHRCFNNNLKQSNGAASLDRHSISENEIKKKMFNMMQLRKQLVQEIPRFARKMATRGNTDLGEGERVVYIEDEKNYKCTVRWVGKSQNNESTVVGVEFDDPVGTGDGAYNGERKFYTRDNYAGFIEPLYLIRESDYNPKASVDILSECTTRPGNGEELNNLETDGVEDDQLQLDEDLQIHSKLLYTNQLNSSSLEDLHIPPVINTPVAHTPNQKPVPKPRKKSLKRENKNNTNSSLKIGDNVAYFHEDKGMFCKAVVKWIGELPDAREGATTVGVEFDEAIGSGTGKYKEHRLFYAKMNHASLIPIGGLLKYEDVFM